MNKKSLKNQWFHSVYFWLDRTLDAAQRRAFRKTLEDLAAIPSVRQIAVGEPVSSERPAVDSTYDVGLTTVFDDEAGHQLYQEHALHKDFLAKYRTFWKKVVVYDFQTHPKKRKRS